MTAFMRGARTALRTVPIPAPDRMRPSPGG
jgi:hypothetical protein